mmetsp:Transcript_22197/g.88081  ORF Transcript_22197/g.88081 Transcript_22197/m.88081 type:complete len:204 (-) Transcript_22197:18-629(-)
MPASEPPAPARISSMTLRSSLGSEGSSRTWSSRSRSDCCASSSRVSSLASSRSSASSVASSKRAFESASSDVTRLYVSYVVTVSSAFDRCCAMRRSAAASETTSGSASRAVSSSNDRAISSSCVSMNASRAFRAVEDGGGGGLRRMRMPPLRRDVSVGRPPPLVMVGRLLLDSHAEAEASRRGHARTTRPPPKAHAGRRLILG